MRRALLAATLLAGLTPAARAQWAVIDAANLAQAAQNVQQGAQQLEQGVQQINQLTSQIGIMRQQYGQLLQTYQAIAHAPDAVMATIGNSFAVPQLRSPVPGTGAELGSIMAGLGGGTLSGAIANITNGNRIYAPTGTDGRTVALNATAASIAGSQAMAQSLFQSASEHAAALWTLEAQLANAPDAKATADIQARLQMEQAQLQARQIQVQAMQSAQTAQVRQTAQEHEESRRCYIDVLLAGSDEASGTCTRAGAAPGFAVAGAGNGAASIAAGYDRFLGQSVGSGQCVALVQAADSSVGLTATWKQGQQVQGASLAPGTAIATFDGAGKYANATNGSSHAAIYLGQNEQGIQVQDQWLGHAASVRTISWSGNNQSNSGSAFYVINH